MLCGSRFLETASVIICCKLSFESHYIAVIFYCIEFWDDIQQDRWICI